MPKLKDYLDYKKPINLIFLKVHYKEKSLDDSVKALNPFRIEYVIGVHNGVSEGGANYFLEWEHRSQFINLIEGMQGRTVVFAHDLWKNMLMCEEEGKNLFNEMHHIPDRWKTFGTKFIQYKQGELRFLDSRNFLKTSDDPNELYDRITYLLERFCKNKNVPYGLGGLTKSFYLSNYAPPIFMHDKKEVIELERESFFGARNETYITGDLEKIYAIDVNNLYGYIMANYKFPCRKLTQNMNVSSITQTDALKDVKRYLEQGHCIIAKVFVEVPKELNVGPFPYRWKREKEPELTIFPVGSFNTYLTTEELKYGFEKGFIKEVHSYAVYEAQDLFSKYVEFCNELRLSNDKVDKYVGKFMVNMLFGKFGETDQFNNFKPNTFPAIAAHITGNSRSFMYQAMEKLRMDTVLYIDNDGFIITPEGYERALELDLVDNTELGKFKYEGKGKGHIYAQKQLFMKDNEGNYIKNSHKNIPNAVAWIDEETGHYWSEVDYGRRMDIKDFSPLVIRKNFVSRSEKISNRTEDLKPITITENKVFNSLDTFTLDWLKPSPEPEYESLDDMIKQSSSFDKF